MFRLTPTPAHIWRRWLLRRWGAKIGRGVRVYSSAKIWAPWNLDIGDFVTIGPDVNLYTVDKIVVKNLAIVSQGAHLCTATHDYSSGQFDLLTGPVTVGENGWIASEAFIAPGIRIGTSAVVGARAIVTHDVADSAIVAGNPAKVIGQRPPEGRNYLGR